MTSTKRAKPKSPPVPSRSLSDCFADVKKLYSEYSHATFSRGEIASALNVSATSGPFGGRLYSLKEFGLIDSAGSEYRVSDTFMTMNSKPNGSMEFKTAALGAIRQSDTFRELLDEFKSKLPSADAVAGRLETQKRFNRERAKVAATVLEESMRYAGLIDNNNNVLPVRGTPTPEDSGETNENDEADENEHRNDPPPPARDDLRVEVPVGEDRKVLVYYPRDLTSDEAQKVGRVLAAIVA